MKKCTLFVILAIWSGGLFADPGDLYYVSVLQAPVHAEASQDSEQLFVVALGRKVVDLGRDGDWMFAGIDKMGGKMGWIKIKNIGPTDPDGLTY